MSIEQIKVIPLTANIGAEVQGIKLSGNLDQTLVQNIYQILLEHKVIFFRGQNHLDDQEQEAFSALLGKPVKHPQAPAAKGSKYILELNSQKSAARANMWHTDVTFIDAYPKITILRGVVIPDVGGDTTWANAESAYDELPIFIKTLADQLWSIHSNDYDYSQLNIEDAETQEKLQKIQASFSAIRYETKHPVVRVHPETGRRSLILGTFLKRFVGLSQRESIHLYNLLQERVTRPENTVRWRWQPGDVAIWDNRATQHLAVNDYGNKHRVVRRVTLAGDIPVNVKGEKSVLLFPKVDKLDNLEDSKTEAILASN
ncbi:MAG: TauD/TfdA family dioxygenase [Acinetobacter populi]|jgi:taurine dioxygenase|uniref:TauD/TfdA dioxygenase family protein n=1 Tax=Acinetobacter populi TaxID=1582270 RepID=UPI002357D95D|nr:TauD/TfdA family dioxygenase [Acinetobacter populi]MCH4247179.1 TauD/TfdA family dioxygenase [Acinetobacter populi]